jgi:predicted SAM-dependent methyltransferase
VKALQVGGGRHVVKGWLNGDLIAGDVYLDAARRLRFPDDSFDIVFAEHFIEHLSLEDGSGFLGEAYRVLRPGGVLRISTPSLDKVLATYAGSNPLVDQNACLTRHSRLHRRGEDVNPCQFVNDLFRLWGHRFLYDQPTLERSLARAGFEDVEWVAFGVSRNDALQDRERHAEVEWMKNGLVMICEARKQEGSGPVRPPGSSSSG